MPAKEPPIDSLIDHLERFLPTYLTATSKRTLSDQIRAHPDDKHYFATSWDGPSEPIQGDGWNGFTKIDFHTRNRHVIAGIVLSNSCDINEDNPSLRSRNIIFAPIIPLRSYENRIRNLPDTPEDKIISHLDAIRKQDTTDIFYLPKSGGTPEVIVQFDDIAAQPIGIFTETGERKKLFRLNNYGFYIMLMKLSIHFTRFGEELDRGGVQPSSIDQHGAVSPHERKHTLSFIDRLKNRLKSKRRPGNRC